MICWDLVLTIIAVALEVKFSHALVVKLMKFQHLSKSSNGIRFLKQNAAHSFISFD